MISWVRKRLEVDLKLKCYSVKAKKHNEAEENI